MSERTTALVTGGAGLIGSPTFGADDEQGIILRIDLSAERSISVPPDFPVGPACP